MKRFSFLISAMVFGFIVLIASAPHAKAADINVPDDHATIQEAIEASGDGDVVIVDVGIYVENINFLGKAITVKSTDPNNQDVVAATIIDGNQVSDTVTFNNGEGPDSILSGFTVQNGFDGIYCEDSSPIITNCFITLNSTGISINQSRPKNFRPNITNCTISNNSSNGSNSGGVICYGAFNISDCTISENSRYGISCRQYTEIRPLSFVSAKPKISDCLIMNNGGGGIYGGGGIGCDYASPTISHCTIVGNFGFSGGGIGMISSGCSPIIMNCVIARNSANAGGGIYCRAFIIFAPQELGEPYFYFPRPKIINCTITENSATTGGGICSDLYAAVFLTGFVPIPGGRILSPFSSPIVTNCIVWGNLPDDVYGNKIKINYSNIQGRYFGIGNINTDPLFVDPNAGDYRLQPGSPCINEGKRGYEMGAYGTYEGRIPWSRSGTYLKRQRY